MTNEIIAKLKQATDNLLMMSESESPLTVFWWSDQTQASLTHPQLLQITSHPPETLIETVELDHFFRNCAQAKEWHDEIQAENVIKFQTLIKTLKDNLTHIQVYRLGTINIDVYIVGTTPSGDLAGVSTQLVET